MTVRSGSVMMGLSVGCASFFSFMGMQVASDQGRDPPGVDPRKDRKLWIQGDAINSPAFSVRSFTNMSSTVVLFRRFAAPRSSRVMRMLEPRPRSIAMLTLAGGSTFVEHLPRHQQLRWKHGGKRGQHLQKLDETGNRQEKEIAQERRKKKKDKKAAREGKVSEKKMAKSEDDNVLITDIDYEDEDEELDDENLLPDPKEIKIRLTKHVDSFQHYLRGVRGSEPSPELFDDITVIDAYGKGTGSTSLQSVAQVVISSPTLAVATCYVRDIITTPNEDTSALTLRSIVYHILHPFTGPNNVQRSICRDSKKTGAESPKGGRWSHKDSSATTVDGITTAGCASIAANS